MNLLDRYIGLTVAATMIMAVIVLLGVQMLFTFLEQTEDIRNDYTIAHVARFVFYSLPRIFYESIPYAALIGCLAGVGLLANNGELIVMRSVGVSTWSITRSALKPALAMIVLGLVVGELVLPDFERMARIDRLRALSEGSAITEEFGVWFREGNVYMHFDMVGKDGGLEGVSHYEFAEDQSLVRTLYAEKAAFQEQDNGQLKWLLEKVTLTDLSDDTADVIEEPWREWQTSLTPDLISTEIAVQPDKMSIGELNSKIEYMQSQGLNSSKFELGFWGKVLQPLATISLVLVGISFVFGPLKEASMGMRVFSGIIIGVLFEFVKNLLSPASLVFGFSPIIAVVIPIAVCFVSGCYLLRRAN